MLSTYPEGINAYHDMQGIDANPYEIYSLDWIDWNRGWHDAKRVTLRESNVDLYYLEYGTNFRQ